MQPSDKLDKAHYPMMMTGMMKDLEQIRISSLNEQLSSI